MELWAAPDTMPGDPGEKPRMLSTLLSVLSIAIVSAPPLVANFDSGVDAWTIQTRSSPTGSFAVMGDYSLSWISAGGQLGGFVQELDPDNQWSYFRAPESWMGDRSDAYGRDFSFSIRTDTLNFFDGRIVVLIGNNGQKISRDAGVPPIDTWTRRHLPLVEGEWRNGSSASGSVATQAQILAVLGDLEHILIGMEFGSDLLEELVGLDSVYFGHCVGDTNLDGVITPLDFTAWIAAYNSGSPLCDQNSDGSCTPADFTAWVANFNAGC